VGKTADMPEKRRRGRRAEQESMDAWLALNENVWNDSMLPTDFEGFHGPAKMFDDDGKPVEEGDPRFPIP
jgi:hypothetical protein